MSFRISPWLTFLLGVIVGWLLIWLPTRWWARRQQRSPERSVLPEIELPTTGLRPAGEASVSLTAQAPVAGPVAPVPETEGASVVEAPLPTAGVEAPVAGPVAPVPEREGVSVAEAPLPTAGVEAPVAGPVAPVPETEGVSVAEAPLPTAGVSAPQGEVTAAAKGAALTDDLTLIWGIGPRFAEQLTAAGITTFAALAQADEARLAEIIAAPAWRKANYGEWIAQARLAAAGDEAGFKALVEELSHRRAEKV